MTRFTRTALAILTLAASATGRAAPVNVKVAGDIQVQFLYSKAFFEDSMVFSGAYVAGTTTRQTTGVTVSALNGGCPYESYRPSGQATATPILNCIFDQGTCSNPPNNSGATVCPFQPALFSYTCSCMTNQPFITVGNIQPSAIDPNNGLDLDFQLYIDTTDRATVSPRVSQYMFDGNPALQDPNAEQPGEVAGSFDHLKPHQVSADTFILQWEDQANGGDNDFNDYVAVVRIVPVTCSTVNPPAYCLSAQYTGLGTLRMLTHVKVDDPTAAVPVADPGISFETVFETYETTATKVAACQRLTLDFGGNGTTEPAQQEYNYANTTGKPACKSPIGGDSGPPTIAFSQFQYRTLNTGTIGSPNFNSTGGGACDSSVYTGAPRDDMISIVQSPDGLHPQETAAYYPNGAPSATVSFANDWDPVVQPLNEINQPNTKKSEATIRTALYNVGSAAGLPLTTYLYQPGTTNFWCPSGVDLILAPTVNDAILPISFTQSGGGTSISGTKLQGVPDVVALNSPVDLTIGTVPMGYEHSSLEVLQTFIYNDNLPDLDPTRSHLSGIISVTADQGMGEQTIDVNQPFLAGGSGAPAVSKLHVHLAFPNGLPDGFKAQLVGILRSTNSASGPGQTLIVSTIPLSHDHTPPTISAASTVRSEHGVIANATVADPVSGIGAVHVFEGVNGASVGKNVMSVVAGNFYDATQWDTSFSGLQPTDVVTLDLDADDTHFNTTTAVRLPVANTGGDRQVECQSQAGANVLLDGSRSTGPTDVSVSYLWSGPFGAASGVSVVEPLAFGPNSVELALTDGRGFTGIEQSVVTVGDTTPPSLTVTATPSCLWPPNHGLVPFKLGGNLAYTVHDTCDPNPTVQIVSVTASDGSIVSFDGTHFCADAAKAPMGGAEVYTVTVRATDAHGNSSTATATITVPHDNTQNCPNVATVSSTDPQCQF